MNISAETIAALRQYDSATVANAIETFGVRPDPYGYTGPELRCMLPDLGAMVGVAVTGMMAPRDPGDQDWRAGWLEFCQAIEDTPGDSVAVIAESPLWRFQAALIGEVMSTVMQSLGAVGCVTDGAVRDLEQIRALSFHCHAAGVIVSHGSMKFVECQQPVRLGRLTVRPGDLLHGDANGIVRVPAEIAADVPAAAQRIMDREAEIMGEARRPGFRVADMRRFY